MPVRRLTIFVDFPAPASGTGVPLPGHRDPGV